MHAFSLSLSVSWRTPTHLLGYFGCFVCVCLNCFRSCMEKSRPFTKFLVFRVWLSNNIELSIWVGQNILNWLSFHSFYSFLALNERASVCMLSLFRLSLECWIFEIVFSSAQTTRAAFGIESDCTLYNVWHYSVPILARHFTEFIYFFSFSGF